MEDNFKSANPLRYNIKLRLAALDQEVQARIKKRIRGRLKVSESTISRWLHLKRNDGADLPAKALLEFSYQLNTKMEDLFNDLK